MPDVKFVVVQDQDSNDCYVLKKELVDLCRKSNDKECLVRIACHELESWYVGDLDAVSQAYGKDLNWVRRKAAYRIPDSIINPKRELQKFLPEHQQILGAKKIAEHIDIESNTSESFRIFVSGVRSMVEEDQNIIKSPQISIQS